jgi:hypothetical protein
MNRPQPLFDLDVEQPAPSPCLPTVIDLKPERIDNDRPSAEARRQSEEFDWNTDPSIVLHEQRRTAVYFNPGGSLVIRQQKDWDEEQDPFLLIAPENAVKFLDAVCDVFGIPSFGGPEPPQCGRRST